MKYTLISVIILAIILCFCIVNTYVVNKICSEMLDLIQAAEEDMKAEKEGAEKSCQNVSDSWAKYRPYLTAVCHHEATEQVETELAAMKVAAERKLADEFFIHSAMAKDLLEHIRQEERLSLSNVF